jgi:penicillin-insensitive murein endopeptidase
MRVRSLLVATVMVALAAPSSIAFARGCPTGFRHPVALPKHGNGWIIPTTWADRGLAFGTSSMIGLIERVAGHVHGKHGPTLWVADISPRGGGASEWHKSHKCGRDADLLFFAIDDNGDQPAAPPHMIAYDRNGEASVGGVTWHFDTARNWALVKSLVQDRVTIDKLFIADHLKKKLLAYARAHKESAALIARAEALMMQPGDAGPHDDHLHVRIAASASDDATYARSSTTRGRHSHAHARHHHH